MSRFNLAKIHKHFQQRPIRNSLVTKENTALAPTSIQAALKKFCELNILSEIAWKKKGRVYPYKGYIDLMSEGTELPQ